MTGVRVVPDAPHRQSGTPINGTTETGTVMHGTANAGTVRGILPVGKGRLYLHVPWIGTLPVLVIPIMGGSTVAMMIPVPGTTAGTTGIGTETEKEKETEKGTEKEKETETKTEKEIEIEKEKGTGTGIWIEDTTDETPGRPGKTTVQTVRRRVEEDMAPGRVTGTVAMTTEEKETGSEGGVGTVTINGPEIANMTGDRPPRPIVLHHYRRAVVSSLLLISMDILIMY